MSSPRLLASQQPRRSRIWRQPQGLRLAVPFWLCRCSAAYTPPGGAAALTAVIGGHSIHAAGFGFALLPVGLNSIALVALAMLYHRLTGHNYPHRATPAVAAEQVLQAAGFHLEDVDKALEDMDESFDISREDLDLLLSRAELHAISRRKAL
jgi:CBS domain-containing membrane protein